MTDLDILPTMKTIIADVLAVDEADIQAEHSLVHDLGAESIDFLDLIFQIEQTFGVKIPRGQLEKDARGELSAEEFAKDGVVTPAGMQALREFFSEVPAEKFTKSLREVEIPSLFTVATLCKLVERAKAGHPEAVLAD